MIYHLNKAHKLTYVQIGEYILDWLAAPRDTDATETEFSGDLRVPRQPEYHSWVWLFSRGVSLCSTCWEIFLKLTIFQYPSHLPLPTPQLSSGGDPGQGGHNHLVWDVRQAAPPRQAVRKDKDVESGLVSLIFRSSKNDQKFNPSSRNAKKIGNISNQVGVWGIKVRMEFPFNFSSFLLWRPPSGTPPPQGGSAGRRRTFWATSRTWHPRTVVNTGVRLVRSWNV